MTLEDDKTAARQAAFARRKAAHADRAADPSALLRQVLSEYAGRPVAGYMPIRTEIDPLPAMAEASLQGRVGVPVIEAKGAPLVFADWTPGTVMVDGLFGAAVPEVRVPVVPEIVIVPLVAFDRRGGRLGYGGGFYDRTLEGLRARGPVLAVGFAYAAQEAEALPLEPTDQPLDLIVTERDILAVAPAVG